MIHFDTSFAIDLLRVEARDRFGAASKFLEGRDESVAVSVFVACELEAGLLTARNPSAERQRLESFLRAATIVLPDERFPAVYADVVARLRRSRQTVDALDLLIAATAIGADANLVTRNRRHFDRIPGLRVLSY